jgi:hypothetical protein
VGTARRGATPDPRGRIIPGRSSKRSHARRACRRRRHRPWGHTRRACRPRQAKLLRLPGTPQSWEGPGKRFPNDQDARRGGVTVAPFVTGVKGLPVGQVEAIYLRNNSRPEVLA